jgi:hypothetical protein
MITQAEVKEEFRSAEQDFARGDFVELTVEELDRGGRVAVGESCFHRFDEQPRSS